MRVVHDYSQSREVRDVTQKLKQAGIEVHIQKGSRGGILHNKFLVIDSTYVITGSFNWTNNATLRNDENFVVLDDQGPKFEHEFQRLWERPEKLASPRPRRSRRPRHFSSFRLSMAAAPVAPQAHLSAEALRATPLCLNSPTTNVGFFPTAV